MEVAGVGSAVVTKCSGKAAEGHGGSKGHKPCGYPEEEHSSRRNRQSRGLRPEGTWSV